MIKLLFNVHLIVMICWCAVLRPTKSYWNRRTWKGPKISLVVRSHPLVAIYFDNKRTNITSFEKIVFCQIFTFYFLFHNNIRRCNWNLFKYLLIYLSAWCNQRMVYAFIDPICYVWRIPWQCKPMSNLLRCLIIMVNYALMSPFHKKFQ